MRKYIFIFLTLLSINVLSKTITISKISQAPVIDGVLETSVWDPISPNKCLESNGNSGGEGFATEFKMCYDNKYLYIAVSVKDPTPNIISSDNVSWKSDCVQLYFAMDTSGTPKTYSNGDDNAFFIRKVAATSMEEGGFEGAGKLTAEVIKVEQKDGPIYTQEWAIPFNALLEGYYDWHGKNWNGNVFMFDMNSSQANDEGTAREYMLFWNNAADNQYNTIQNQGYIYLSEKLLNDSISNPFPTTNKVDLEILKTSSPIVIDGALENAWNDVPFQTCAKTKGYGNEDFKAQFKMCYDNTNVYIAVAVNDPTPNVISYDNVSWKSDCVQLYFAMDTNSSSYYRPGDWEIRKLAAKSLEEGGIDGSSNVNNDFLSKIKVAQIEGYPYVQEWSIPWSSLVEDGVNFDGEYFRFDIMVAQANEFNMGREFQAFWHSNADMQWTSTEYHGLVWLRKFYDNNCNSDLWSRLEYLENLKKELQDTIEYLKLKVNIEETISMKNTTIEIFPNPAYDNINIKANNIIYSYELFNLSGSVLQKRSINEASFSISIDNLMEGTYILRLNSPEGPINRLVQIK